MADESAIEANGSTNNGDSRVFTRETDSKLLEVYATGETTVVGFGGRKIPADHNVANYRQELLDIIAEHGTRELAFDLTGVGIVPSGIVGLIATMHNHGVSVTLYNASSDIREVFSITRLDDVVTFREIDAR